MLVLMLIPCLGVGPTSSAAAPALAPVDHSALGATFSPETWQRLLEVYTKSSIFTLLCNLTEVVSALQRAKPVPIQSALQSQALLDKKNDLSSDWRLIDQATNQAHQK